MVLAKPLTVSRMTTATAGRAGRAGGPEAEELDVQPVVDVVGGGALGGGRNWGRRRGVDVGVLEDSAMAGNSGERLQNLIHRATL